MHGKKFIIAMSLNKNQVNLPELFIKNADDKISYCFIEFDIGNFYE